MYQTDDVQRRLCSGVRKGVHTPDDVKTMSEFIRSGGLARQPRSKAIWLSIDSLKRNCNGRLIECRGPSMVDMDCVLN
jgi:hypothetical protein